MARSFALRRGPSRPAREVEHDARHGRLARTHEAIEHDRRLRRVLDRRGPVLGAEQQIALDLADERVAFLAAIEYTLAAPPSVNVLFGRGFRGVVVPYVMLRADPFSAALPL